MKTTRNLAASLLEKEARSFALSLNPPKKSEKMIVLFPLLREHGKTELSRAEKQEMERTVYGNLSGGKRFEMLCHRLQEKINEFLLSQNTLNNHPVLENLHAVQAGIKKNHAMYNFMHYTGRSGNANDALLDKTIELAKKYECYSDLIQMLHVRQLRRGYRMGENEIEKAAEEINFYKKCEHAIRRATELYYRLLIRKKFSGNPVFKQLQLFLKTGINELKELIDQTHSPSVKYFLKYLEMDFFENEKNFISANNKCAELLAIVRKNVSVFTRQRVDYALGNMAQCHIYLGEYRKALNIIRKQQYIIPYSLDWLESRELEFRILFYQNKYSEAKRLLESMQTNSPADLEPFRKEKIKFFHACVLFRQKNYSGAIRIIRSNSGLHKDKSGWSISIRLMELMLFFEQNKKKEVHHAAELLCRFSHYHIKNNPHSKRDVLMLNLLPLLIMIDFEPNKVIKHLWKCRKLLIIKKGDYAWDPCNHEIIRYDELIEHMLEKRRKRYRV